MGETFTAETGLNDATKFRLRRDVYDSLIARLGDPSVVAQVSLFGISRPTLHRIRAGKSPSLDTAMRVAKALGVPVDVLFERTESAA